MVRAQVMGWMWSSCPADRGSAVMSFKNGGWMMNMGYDLSHLSRGLRDDSRVHSDDLSRQGGVQRGTDGGRCVTRHRHGASGTSTSIVHVHISLFKRLWRAHTTR